MFLLSINSVLLTVCSFTLFSRFFILFLRLCFFHSIFSALLPVCSFSLFFRSSYLYVTSFYVFGPPSCLFLRFVSSVLCVILIDLYHDVFQRCIKTLVVGSFNRLFFQMAFFYLFAPSLYLFGQLTCLFFHSVCWVIQPVYLFFNSVWLSSYMFFLHPSFSVLLPVWHFTLFLRFSHLFVYSLCFFGFPTSLFIHSAFRSSCMFIPSLYFSVLLAVYLFGLSLCFISSLTCLFHHSVSSVLLLLCSFTLFLPSYFSFHKPILSIDLFLPTPSLLPTPSHPSFNRHPRTDDDRRWPYIHRSRHVNVYFPVCFDKGAFLIYKRL